MPVSAYIVDDEKYSNKRLVYMLQNFLHGEVKVLGTSTNPEEVLDVVPQTKPDILFLDIEMPEMSGIDLAKQLQSKGYWGRIIFVSGYKQYLIKALRSNAFDFILKPVDVDELKRAIERYKKEIDREFNPEIVRKYNLSKREMEVVSYLGKGLSSEEIAEKLFLSKNTVDTHRRNVLHKTKTRNVVELLNLLRSR